MTSLIDVMAWKYGGKFRFRVSEEYESLVWEDDESFKPTKEQVDLDTLAYNEYYKTIYHKNLRLGEYPRINDLVVALWERIVENRPEASETIQTKRMLIKEKYPKNQS
jgi:hypothetical protein